MGIQCKGLAKLSDLSHCSTLKASVSIVRAGRARFPCKLRMAGGKKEGDKETENDRKFKKVRRMCQSINNTSKQKV